MGLVLSIDLAYRKIRDFGVCVLAERRGRPAGIRFVDPERELGLKDRPHPQQCAHAISSYCRKHGVRVLLLDGPQGWKDPSSKLPHSRHCEKLLHAQGKVGPRGSAKPRSFAAFANFSIELFAALLKEGGKLVRNRLVSFPRIGFLVVECYPASAWRKLCIAPLPAKKRAQECDVRCRLRILQRLFGFGVPRLPNHDELQALVAGLAGVAILAGDTARYVADGTAPKKVGGVVVEGFIMNPCLEESVG
ncbi:MAG: DUF429 domain-containing protein [Acidobacteria bacterium]|nr:DUF429 domain-containing protein [Acidobacteriota bacterium]